MGNEAKGAGPAQFDNCPHFIQKETATLYLMPVPDPSLTPSALMYFAYMGRQLSNRLANRFYDV